MFCIDHLFVSVGPGDTWTSVLNEAMTEIDIMGNNFALNKQRESIGYFSEKQVDMSAFMVQISGDNSPPKKWWQDAFRFVEPFSGGVWLALCVCMVVSALVVYILDWSFYVERREEKKIEAPGKSRFAKVRNAARFISKTKSSITQRKTEKQGQHITPFEIEGKASYHSQLQGTSNAVVDTYDQHKNMDDRVIQRNSIIEDKIHNLFKYVKPKDKDDDSYDSEDEDFGERLKISMFDSFYLAFVCIVHSGC
jgi:hypothetical protein